MDSPIGFLVLILFVVVGIALLIFLSCRAVLWARTKRGGSESVGGLIGSMGLGSAINPAEAVVEEKQRVKRSEDGSGDPDELES